ncbi:MAG: outer membrane beta-barrel protein [Gammaproteobacteria bacterium]
MQKRHLLMLFATAAMAVSATAACAAAPRYDFAGLSYQFINHPAGSDVSTDEAFGISGSYVLTDNWVLGGNYSHENADLIFNDEKVSGNSYELGVGYRFPLMDSVDLVPTLSYLSDHATASGPGLVTNSSTDTGYDAGVELRAMITPVVELDFDVDHTTLGPASNQVGVAVLYNFAPSFAVGLGYAESSANGQNTSGVTLALRYYFK